MYRYSSTKKHILTSKLRTINWAARMQSNYWNMIEFPFWKRRLCTEKLHRIVVQVLCHYRLQLCISPYAGCFFVVDFCLLIIKPTYLPVNGNSVARHLFVSQTRFYPFLIVCGFVSAYLVFIRCTNFRIHVAVFTWKSLVVAAVSRFSVFFFASFHLISFRFRFLGIA